jgi:hypothetical protein
MARVEDGMARVCEKGGHFAVMSSSSISLAEAAQVLGCSVSSLRGWLKRDEFAGRAEVKGTTTRTGTREKVFLSPQLVADIATWREGNTTTDDHADTQTAERVTVRIKMRAIIYG